MRASRGSVHRPRPRPRVTLRDVAARAGVSICTVSQILNGTPDDRAERYSDATRRKVVAVAERLGYRPNLLGRALAARRTYTVGIAMPAVTMISLVAEYLNVLDLRLIAAGYRTMVAGHRDQPDIEEKVVQHLIDQRVDGLVLFPSQQSREQTAQHLIDSGIPTVVFNGHHRRPMWNVRHDRPRGGYLQVRHLLDVGCKRLLFLVDSVTGNTSVAKTAGHTEALAEAGLSYESQMRVVREWQEDASPIDTGRDMVLEARRRRMKFDGVVAMSDRCAAGAMIALRQLGLRVPQDVRVIGIDDEPMSPALLTPLSTIRQSRDIGRIGGDLLLELIKVRYEQSAAALAQMEPRTVLLEPKLIVRESTAP